MKLNIIILLAAFIGTGSIHAMEQEQPACEKTCPYGFCCYQGTAEKTLHAMAIEPNRDEQLHNELAKKYCCVRYVMEPIHWTCFLPCTAYTRCTNPGSVTPANPTLIKPVGIAANHINY